MDQAAEDAALACIQHGQIGEALQILMKAYGTPITAFALRIVRNHEAAKDVRQQVFLEAFQGIDKFQRRASLWTWLCGIAYHRSLDELRRGKRAPPLSKLDQFDVLEELVGEPDPLMDPDQTATRRALERCLEKLAPPLRSQVMMRYFLGLSYAEIGEEVGAPQGTVQVRVSRILPRLRRCLKGEGLP
ncbi:MAG TPA: sigma-70 family RNA polymerase sigma factor [Kofleriaceae bacterium]|nr:sigma-70 family RNA polymerase sigma factor [Kofleriaceae bacterium]